LRGNPRREQGEHNKNGYQHHPYSCQGIVAGQASGGLQQARGTSGGLIARNGIGSDALILPKKAAQKALELEIS
jgi:hypothetical protein